MKKCRICGKEIGFFCAFLNSFKCKSCHDREIQRILTKDQKRTKPLSALEKTDLLDGYGYECGECGYQGDEKGLHIYHKDHNPHNNSQNNLTVLCDGCFRKAIKKNRK